MRVLFVTESLSLAKNTGVASTTISLARELSRRIEVELLAPTASSDLEDTQELLQGLTAHLFPQSPLLPRTVVPSLGQFLQREIRRFDRIHLHGMWRYPQWAAARSAQRWRIPYVISPHGMCEPFELARKAWKKRIFFNLVERRTFEQAAAIHAITEAEQRHCLQVLQHLQHLQHQSNKPIAVIPHGVTVPSLVSEHHLPASLAHIPPQAPLILFLGRLHPKKGLDLLVPAFSQVLTQHPTAHLVVAGPDAGYQGAVMQLAKEYGIGDRLDCPGLVTGLEKQALLQRAHVFTLPSYSEGFSVAILEALAAAKPVVISQACYFDEVVAAGCGLVFDQRLGTGVLAHSLSQILSLAEGDRTTLGQRGRRLIQQHYTWSAAADQMIRLYQSVSPPERVMVSA